jgi:hypothetical protein
MQHRSQINHMQSLCMHGKNVHQCDYPSTYSHSPNVYELIFAHSGTTMQMQKGQIVLTPYAVVEQLLAVGNVELI